MIEHRIINFWTKKQMAEELFGKIRNKFRETVEKEWKIKQLRTIEQERRTYDEYVQEFKKVVWESSYERWPLIEEFKRGLSKTLRGSTKVSSLSQMSTSGLTAKVSSILSEFLYPPFQMLGNPVTGSIYCGVVIARSTVDVVRGWLVEVIEVRVVVLDGNW